MSNVWQDFKQDFWNFTTAEKIQLGILATVVVVAVVTSICAITDTNRRYDRFVEALDKNTRATEALARSQTLPQMLSDMAAQEHLDIPHEVVPDVWRRGFPPEPDFNDSSLNSRVLEKRYMDILTGEEFTEKEARKRNAEELAVRRVESEESAKARTAAAASQER